MRLPRQSIEIVKDAVGASFPGHSRTFLFGSRTHDDRRGGDIDLLVVSDAERSTLEGAKIKALVRIQMALGEQHIDMVVTSGAANDPRPVVHEAMRTGVEL